MLVGAALLATARAISRVTAVPFRAVAAALQAVGWQPTRTPGSLTVEIAAGTAERLTAERNAWFRAAYVIKSARRIEAKVAAGASMEDAILAEKRYYVAHQGADLKRTLNAQRVDNATATYGPLLGWHATIDGRTDPECRKANGGNFEAGRPPVIGYPGSVHPSCRCVPGPPFPRGKRLASLG